MKVLYARMYLFLPLQSLWWGQSPSKPGLNIRQSELILVSTINRRNLDFWRSLLVSLKLVHPCGTLSHKTKWFVYSLRFGQGELFSNQKLWRCTGGESNNTSFHVKCQKSTVSQNACALNYSIRLKAVQVCTKNGREEHILELDNGTGAPIVRVWMTMSDLFTILNSEYPLYCPGSVSVVVPRLNVGVPRGKCT